MDTKSCAMQRSREKNNKTSILGHDGRYMIPIHSKICQGMRDHFEKEIVYLESNIFNFHLNREVKSAETHNVNDAEQCFAKESQQSGNEYGRAVRS